MYGMPREKFRTSTSVFGMAVYPHMPILRTRHPVESPTGTFFIVVHALADLSDFGLLGSKVPKMCDSLLRTPINRRAKFYATYFIIGGKIRNRTKNKQKTVNDKTIYPYLAYRRVTGICRTEM